MKEINVFSKNSTYQKFEVLKTNRNKRHRYGEFLVEGVRNINGAIQNKWRIKHFIYDRDQLSDWARDTIASVKTAENYCLTPELMAELSGKTDFSELMAVIEMRDTDLSQVKLSEKPFLMLFDRPSNKGNLGTVIRSCDAFGVDMLIITGHAVDLYDPDVVVSSMGSFFHVPVICVTDNTLLYDYLEELKTAHPDLTVIGTTAHKEHPIYNSDLSNPVLLMIGNETMGLNKAFKEYSDILCTIPMSEGSYASSFNVGCAASILMYEVARQRTV